MDKKTRRKPRKARKSAAGDSLTLAGYSPGSARAPGTMIRSFQIDNYRGFKRFDMDGLGRINLLVGRNNSGKTSVLEGLYLLSSGGEFYSVWELCNRRGERLWEQRDPRVAPSEVDISHLFNGHEPHPGTHFSFKAKNERPERIVTFTVVEPSDKERVPQKSQAGQVIQPTLMLHVTEHHKDRTRAVPLNHGLGLNYDSVEQSRRGLIRRIGSEGSSTQFISPDSLRSDELINLWDKITLTTNEETVLQALRFIDPKIERIAPQTSARIYGGKGGFIIKRSDMLFPIPIGSLGDGIWRMLAMAIAITQCRNGTLLIDEIDTGLHYSVMADMWKLIQRAAREFNVQVFATTHSYDCVHSLATICVAEPAEQEHITIHRIEIDKKASIRFTEPQIKIAADREIEIR